MKCHELAKCIERLQPDALMSDVARLCLLLCNYVDNPVLLKDEEHLRRAWREISVMLEAVTDQYAAMTADLEDLSRANPAALTVDQIMVLIRAIKVQSRVINLYVRTLPVDAKKKNKLS
jgi:hypothetical protein